MAVVFEDGKLVQDTIRDVVWAGFFSVAHSQGDIVRHVQSCLQQLQERNINTVMVIPKSDGEDHNKNLWAADVDKYRKYAADTNKVFILGMLSNKLDHVNDPKTNIIYLPLDDTFFRMGVYPVLADEVEKRPWDKRSSKLCWRGSCSGGRDTSTVRVRFVEKIFAYDPTSDVRMSRQWSYGCNIPDRFFAAQDRIHYTEFFNHKIFFIVDGNCIASNHMYGFGSGAVPFLLSNAVCWFSHLIEPFVHYVPVAYDLSDLVDKIEWVKNHDDEARCIAERAVAFSKTCFSSEYQRRYILETLQTLVNP